MVFGVEIFLGIQTKQVYLYLFMSYFKENVLTFSQPPTSWPVYNENIRVYVCLSVFLPPLHSELCGKITPGPNPYLTKQKR